MIKVGKDIRNIGRVYLGDTLIRRMYHMGRLVFNSDRIRAILFGPLLADNLRFVSSLAETPLNSVPESLFHITGDDVILEGNNGAVFALAGTTATESSSTVVTYPTVTYNAGALQSTPVGPGAGTKDVLLAATGGIARLNEDDTTEVIINPAQPSLQSSKAMETEDKIITYNPRFVFIAPYITIWDKTTSTVDTTTTVSVPAGATVLGLDNFGGLIGVVHTQGITMFDSSGRRAAARDITATFKGSPTVAGAGLISSSGSTSQQLLLADYEGNDLYKNDNFFSVPMSISAFSRDGTIMYGVDGDTAATRKIVASWTGDEQTNEVLETFTPDALWFQDDGSTLAYSKKAITVDRTPRNEYRFYDVRFTANGIVRTFLDNGGALTSNTDNRVFTHLINTDNYIYGSDALGTLTKFNKITREFETETDFLANGNVLFRMENVLAHAETEGTTTHMRIYDFDLNRQAHLDFEYTPPAGVSHAVTKYDFYSSGYFFIADSTTGDYKVFRHDYSPTARADTPQSFTHDMDYTKVERTDEPTNPSSARTVTGETLHAYYNIDAETGALEIRALSELKPLDPLGFANVKDLPVVPTSAQRIAITGQSISGAMVYEDDKEIIVLGYDDQDFGGEKLHSINKADNTLNGSIDLPATTIRRGVVEKVGEEYYYFDGIATSGSFRILPNIYKTSSIESTSTWEEITTPAAPSTATNLIGISYADRLFWTVIKNDAGTEISFAAYDVTGTPVPDKNFTDDNDPPSGSFGNSWGFGRWIIVRQGTELRVYDVSTGTGEDIALADDLTAGYYKMWRNSDKEVIGERNSLAAGRFISGVGARTRFIAPFPPVSLPVVGFDSVVISRGVRQIAPRISDITNRVRAFLDNTGSGLENKAVGYAANSDTTTFYYVPNNTGLRITSSDGYYSVTVSTDSNTTNVGRICLETDDYIWFVHSQYIGTAPNYTSASHRLGRIKKSDRTSEFFINFSTSTTETMVGLEILDDDYIGVVSSNKVYVYTKEDGTRDTGQDITLSTAIPSSSLVYSGIAVNNDGNGSLTFTNHEGKSVTTRFPGIIINSADDIYTLSSDRTRLYFGRANQGAGADASYHPIKFFKSPTYPATQLAGTTITASDSQGVTFADNYAPVGPALDAKGMILTSTAGVRRLNEDNTVTQLTTFVNALSNRFDKVLETETDIYGYTESTTTLVRVRKSTGAVLYTNSSVTLPEAVSQNRPQTTAVIGMDIFGPGNLIGIVHSEGITLFNDDCTVNDTYGSAIEFGTFTRQRYSARRAGAGLVIENEGGAFQYRDYVNNIVVTADQSIGTQGGATDLIYSRDGTQMLTHDGTNWFKWTISWN